MKTILQQNIAALSQGEALLLQISDEVFNKMVTAVFDSTIGTHIRHNLDHYNCFIVGLKNGHIDYAVRARDPRIEEDRGYALTEINRLRIALETLLDCQDYPHVSVECDVSPGLALSSVQRELEFLLSHTVHHYAIIAIICRLQGILIDDEFGVAPSTLRYREDQLLQCVH